MYEWGQGIAQDHQKAFEWYKKAAMQGHAEAQYRLGFMYKIGAAGLGIEQDYKKAFEWYQKAAMHDHAEAQYGLGEIYEWGPGIEKDLSSAFKWFLKAAKQEKKMVSKATTGLKNILELPRQDQPSEAEILSSPFKDLLNEGLLKLKNRSLQDMLESELARIGFLEGRAHFSGNNDLFQTHGEVSRLYGTLLQGIERLLSNPTERAPTLLKVNAQIQDNLLRKNFPQVDIADLSLQGKQAGIPFITFYKWNQDKISHVFVSFEQKAVELSTSLFTVLDGLEKLWQNQKAIFEKTPKTYEDAKANYNRNLVRCALADYPDSRSKATISEEDQSFFFLDLGEPGFKEVLQANLLQVVEGEVESVIQKFLENPEIFQDHLTPRQSIALGKALGEFQARDQARIENSLELVAEIKKTFLDLLLVRHESHKENFNKTYPYLKGLLY